jgi:DNA-binding CsgD family transcriptional regulator
MTALARGDEQRILRFVAEADTFGEEHVFDGGFLTELVKLVPAEWVGFGRGPEYDPTAPQYVGFDRPGDEHVFDHVDWTEALSVLQGEMPPFDYLDHNFGAVKLSDFLNRRELRRSRVYKLVLEPVGLEHTLAVRVPTATEMFFVFDRSERDFTERDREVLLALAPHLARLYEAAETRRRLQTALALHEQTRSAVVLLEAGGRIAFASSAAQELLDRYFGRNGAALPAPIAAWLSEGSKRLRVGSGDRVLVVSHVDDALLLEERRPEPQLTAREREILELVAEGRTNGEIAERLWISPGTVRKHLENLYAKLGVHTRTAAAGFLRH